MSRRGSGGGSRAVFLILIAVIVFAGALFLEVAGCFELIATRPPFIVRVLDRSGFYQSVRETAVAALIEPLEGIPSIPARARSVMRAVVSDAVTPDLIRRASVQLASSVSDSLRREGGKPEFVVDLAPVKAAVSESAARQPGAVGADVSRAVDMLPSRVDLLEYLGIDRVRVTGAFERYREFRKGVGTSMIALGLAAITCVLVAGRSGWGPWLSGPIALSGVVAAALASAGRALVDSRTSASVAATWRLPVGGTGVNQATLAAVADSAVDEFSRALGAVGLAGIAVGAVVLGIWAASRRFDRDRAAEGKRD